jgi:RNA polymerase sigma factor (sigma-70 family)
MDSSAPRSAAPPEPASHACVATPLPNLPPPARTLAAIFETEEGPLLSFAHGLVGRRSVAEDLVQEAFLRLHQVWGDIENPRAWLYRSLRNLALNYLRDHRRETDMPEEEPPADDVIPLDAMGRMEAVGVVRTLLAELPREDSELIRLKYHENLKYNEISQRTGLNVGTVGYKLHHLLKGLADSLRRAGVEGSNG